MGENPMNLKIPGGLNTYRMKKWIFSGIVFGALIFSALIFLRKDLQVSAPFLQQETGSKIDSLNGVYVYSNGKTSNVSGRNIAPDGYNLGLKYQCVEFVKRYYYEHLGHSMPESYGHAKDFFDPSLKDGQLNTARNLVQYRNNGKEKPRVDDILVFKENNFNPYGHIAIVADIQGDQIEIIQQNAGPFSSSRESFKLEPASHKWIVKNSNLLGWLRKR